MRIYLEASRLVGIVVLVASGSPLAPALAGSSTGAAHIFGIDIDTCPAGGGVVRIIA